MEGKIQELHIADMDCRLYLPPGYEEGGDRYPVIYVNGEVPIEGILTKLVEHGAQTDFLFLHQAEKLERRFYAVGGARVPGGGGSAAGQGGRLFVLPDRKNKTVHGRPLLDKAGTGAHGFARLLAWWAYGGLRDL